MVKLNSDIFDSIRGSFKRADLTFQTRKGRIVLEDKPTQLYRRTEAQDRIRTAYRQCCDVWKQLSEEEKEAWREEGRRRGITAFNAFLSNCIKQKLTAQTTAFHYKVIIDNTQNSNDLTDYPVLLIVTNDRTFFNTFSNNHKYLEAYDSDRQTAISFFVEEWDTTNYNAKIWFKIPLISANSTKAIYLKANFNRTASLSNPNAVFDFYDDFNDLSNWRVVRIGGSGYAKVKDGSLKLYSTYTNTTVDAQVALQNVRIDAKVRVVRNTECLSIGVSDGLYASYGWLSNGYSYFWNGWPTETDRQRIVKLVNGTATFLATTANGFLQNNVEYILSVIYASPILKMLNDDIVILTTSDSTFASRSYLCLMVWGTSEYWVDWIRVRKYTSPEPTTSYQQATG